METLKRCNHCGEFKPTTEFHRDRTNSDELSHRCKDCQRILDKKRKKRNRKMAAEKQCAICKEVKPKTEYYIDESEEDRLSSVCVSCQEKLDKIAEEEANLKLYLSSWANSTIHKHRCKGIKVYISAQQLVDLAINTEFCPICGCKLQKGSIASKENSYSVDRIDNENEMRLNNIMIICNRCNMTKGARTLEEFLDYCKSVASREELIRQEREEIKNSLIGNCELQNL